MGNRRFIGNQRSVFMVIILSLLTCGIYSLVWMYQTTKELNEYTGENQINPAMTIVLTLLTCGLYQIFWWYRVNGLLMEAQYQTNYRVVNDNTLLFILLAVFGLSIVNLAIVQSDLNLLWERAVIYEEPENTHYSEPLNNDSVFSDTSTASDDEWTDY